MGWYRTLVRYFSDAIARSVEDEADMDTLVGNQESVPDFRLLRVSGTQTR